jgi:hypothetical protein
LKAKDNINAATVTNMTTATAKNQHDNSSNGKRQWQTTKTRTLLPSKGDRLRAFALEIASFSSRSLAALASASTFVAVPSWR